MKEIDVISNPIDNTIDVLKEWCMTATKDEIRVKIRDIYESMAEALEDGRLVSIEWETNHHFAGTLYGREFSAPANTVIVGKIHKDEHFIFALEGDVDIFSEDGIKRVCAPCFFVSKPGQQRIGRTLTDIKWVSVHYAHTKNIEELEKSIMTMDYQDFLDSQSIIEVSP